MTRDLENWKPQLRLPSWVPPGTLPDLAGPVSTRLGGNNNKITSQFIMRLNELIYGSPLNNAGVRGSDSVHWKIRVQILTHKKLRLAIVSPWCPQIQPTADGKQRFRSVVGNCSREYENTVFHPGLVGSKDGKPAGSKGLDWVY